MEGVWGGFWEGLAALEGSWPFFGVIFSCLCLGWSSKGLLEASGLDFGRIPGGLEGILGGFGEGLGRILEGFFEDLCLIFRDCNFGIFLFYFGFKSIALAAAFSCFFSLSFVFSCRTRFELKRHLARLLAFSCFLLLSLAF